MVKNKTEKLISKSIIADSRLWGIKLHNNMLAHQTTPADYILTLTFLNYHYTILLEAKQVTLKEGKGRLTHKRLKQTNDLIGFENHSSYHKSFYLITFKDNTWANSEIYFIPVLKVKEIMEKHNNVSFNREDMKSLFKDNQIRIHIGSVINLKTDIEIYI